MAKNPDEERSKKTPLNFTLLEQELFRAKPTTALISDSPRQYSVIFALDKDHVETHWVPNVYRPGNLGVHIPGKAKEQTHNENIGMVALKNGEKITVTLPGENPDQDTHSLTIVRNERGKYSISFFGIIEELTDTYAFGRAPQNEALPLPNVHSIIVPDNSKHLSRTQLLVTKFTDIHGKTAIILDVVGKNPIHVGPPTPLFA